MAASIFRLSAQRMWLRAFSCSAMLSTRSTTACSSVTLGRQGQAVIDLVESIALQENALSHILCAESRKMDAAMKLDGLDLCKLLEVNDSATNMVHAVANLELVLKDKLEFVSNNLYYPPADAAAK